MKKMNLDRHEDGRLIISIPTAVIATLLIAMIPAIAAYGAQSQKVSNLEKKIDNIENDVDRLIELEKQSAVQAIMINDLKEDMKEIKEYVKYMYEQTKKQNN